MVQIIIYFFQRIWCFVCVQPAQLSRGSLLVKVGDGDEGLVTRLSFRLAFFKWRFWNGSSVTCYYVIKLTTCVEIT